MVWQGSTSERTRAPTRRLVTVPGAADAAAACQTKTLSLITKKEFYLFLVTLPGIQGGGCPYVTPIFESIPGSF
jgi:hypothetical protein